MLPVLGVCCVLPASLVRLSLSLVPYRMMCVSSFLPTPRKKKISTFLQPGFFRPYRAHWQEVMSQAPHRLHLDFLYSNHWMTTSPSKSLWLLSQCWMFTVRLSSCCAVTAAVLGRITAVLQQEVVIWMLPLLWQLLSILWGAIQACLHSNKLVHLLDERLLHILHYDPDARFMWWKCNFKPTVTLVFFSWCSFNCVNHILTAKHNSMKAVIKHPHVHQMCSSVTHRIVPWGKTPFSADVC